MTDLTHLTVAETRRLLDSRAASAEEIARAYLDKIARTDELNVYLSVNEEATIAQAKEADKKNCRRPAVPF